MEIIDQFVSMQLSDRTKQVYKNALNRFYNHYENSFPEGNKWTTDYIAHLKGVGLGNNTVNLHITAIASFYKKMFDRKLYYDRLKTMPAQVNFLKDEQVATLLKSASKEFEPVIRFMLDTGVRVAELEWVSRQKYWEVPNYFVIIGKGQKQRGVMISDETKKMLKPGLIFGRVWTIRAVQYNLARLSKKNGLGRVWPHMLRHTMATKMLGNGVNILEIKEMLGHAYLATTEVYTHVTQEGLKETWGKYHDKQKTAIRA